MKKLHTLGLCGLAISMAATGLAFAQQAPVPAPAASAAAPVTGQAAGGMDPTPADRQRPQASDSGHRRMGPMDQNADGAIERSEFASRRLDRLKAADTNGDGILSKDEVELMILKRMVERRAARLERRLDTDGDGKVTIAEIEKQAGKRFALMDGNDDGRLDRRELWRMHRAMEMRKGWYGGPQEHDRQGNTWRRDRGEDGRG